MTSVARWDVLELPVPGPGGMRFHHDSGATAHAEAFRSANGWTVRFCPDQQGT